MRKINTEDDVLRKLIEESNRSEKYIEGIIQLAKERGLDQRSPEYQQLCSLQKFVNQSGQYIFKNSGSLFSIGAIAFNLGITNEKWPDLLGPYAAAISYEFISIGESAISALDELKHLNGKFKSTEIEQIYKYHTYIAIFKTFVSASCQAVLEKFPTSEAQLKEIEQLKEKIQEPMDAILLSIRERDGILKEYEVLADTFNLEVLFKIQKLPKKQRPLFIMAAAHQTREEIIESKLDALSLVQDKKLPSIFLASDKTIHSTLRYFESQYALKKQKVEEAHLMNAGHFVFLYIVHARESFFKDHMQSIWPESLDEKKRALAHLQSAKLEEKNPLREKALQCLLKQLAPLIDHENLLTEAENIFNSAYEKAGKAVRSYLKKEIHEIDLKNLENLIIHQTSFVIKVIEEYRETETEIERLLKAEELEDSFFSKISLLKSRLISIQNHIDTIAQNALKLENDPGINDLSNAYQNYAGKLNLLKSLRSLSNMKENLDALALKNINKTIEKNRTDIESTKAALEACQPFYEQYCSTKSSPNLFSSASQEAYHQRSEMARKYALTEIPLSDYSDKNDVLYKEILSEIHHKEKDQKKYLSDLESSEEDFLRNEKQHLDKIKILDEIIEHIKIAIQKNDLHNLNAPIALPKGLDEIAEGLKTEIDHLRSFSLSSLMLSLPGAGYVADRFSGLKQIQRKLEIERSKHNLAVSEIKLELNAQKILIERAKNDIQDFNKDSPQLLKQDEDILAEAKNLISEQETTLAQIKEKFIGASQDLLEALAIDPTKISPEEAYEQYNARKESLENDNIYYSFLQQLNQMDSNASFDSIQAFPAIKKELTPDLLEQELHSKIAHFENYSNFIENLKILAVEIESDEKMDPARKMHMLFEVSTRLSKISLAAELSDQFEKVLVNFQKIRREITVMDRFSSEKIKMFTGNSIHDILSKIPSQYPSLEGYVKIRDRHTALLLAEMEILKETFLSLLGELQLNCQGLEIDFSKLESQCTRLLDNLQNEAQQEKERWETIKRNTTLEPNAKLVFLEKIKLEFQGNPIPFLLQNPSTKAEFERIWPWIRDPNLGSRQYSPNAEDVLAILRHISSLNLTLIEKKQYAISVVDNMLPAIHDPREILKFETLVQNKHKGSVNPYAYIREERHFFRSKYGNTATWNHIIGKVQDRLEKCPAFDENNKRPDSFYAIMQTRRSHTYGLGGIFKNLGSQGAQWAKPEADQEKDDRIDLMR